MRYRTQADYPNFDGGFDGTGIEVKENTSAPRSDAAIGIQSGPIYAGGCFPSVPGDETSPCLVETDSNGHQFVVEKERERWTFRLSYIDPSVANAPEVNVGFGGAYGYAGDDELDWVRHTSQNQSCFTFYSYYCNLYGISLDEILDSVRSFAPGCSNKLGAGYRAQIFYQYSRYKITDTIPPGANEWEPPTTAATTTRLARPGKEVWYRDWSLAPGENAFGVSGGIINPAVPLRYIDKVNASVTLVGGVTTNQIAAGTTRVGVRATECGQAFGNVHFNGTITYQSQSAGHLHTVSHDNSPGNSVSDAPQTFSGVTDANGSWTSPFTITAGQVSGAYELKVQTPDILGGSAGVPVPAASKPSSLMVGFRSLWRFIPPSGAALKLTGDDYAAGVCESQDCDNHKGFGHYGTTALLDFVTKLPDVFHDEVGSGFLGINDMSLPYGGAFDIAGGWSLNYHISHRGGYDVDVDMKVYNADGTLNHDMTVTEKKDFIDAVKDQLGGTIVTEPTIHFRLPGATIDQLIAGGL